jgi:glycine/D-amino acid oxidase-like deaminating enzyme
MCFKLGSLSIYDANILITREPRLLCQFLLQSCLDRGVQLHHPARAISVGKDEHGQQSSIRILNTETKIESDIPCTRMLIAAGAWSPQVFATLFPNSKRNLSLSSLAGHSLVVRSPNWGNEKEADCHAIFTTESGYSPELFSRANGEIYIAGLNSSTLPLPNLPGESDLDADAIQTLHRTAKRLLVTEKEDDLEIVRKGLCFRPVTPRGTPILARILDQDLGGIETKGASEGGVWLAAGHGPWGISMSLGTGKVMAEMIQGEQTSADISGLGL